MNENASFEGGLAAASEQLKADEGAGRSNGAAAAAVASRLDPGPLMLLLSAVAS